MAASFIRDDAPWRYQLAMEVYRAVKSGDPAAIDAEMARLERFSEFMMHGPFMPEFAFAGEESSMFLREFPRVLQHMLRRTSEMKKSHGRRRAQKPQAETT